MSKESWERGLGKRYVHGDEKVQPGDFRPGKTQRERAKFERMK